MGRHEGARKDPLNVDADHAEPIRLTLKDQSTLAVKILDRRQIDRVFAITQLKASKLEMAEAGGFGRVGLREAKNGPADLNLEAAQLTPWGPRAQ